MIVCRVGAVSMGTTGRVVVSAEMMTGRAGVRGVMTTVRRVGAV